MKKGAVRHAMVHLALLIGGICHTAYAGERDLMKQELMKMKSDPLRYQLSIPTKYDVNGQTVTSDQLPFPQSMIDDRSYVTEKDLTRRDAIFRVPLNTINTLLPMFAPINTENDDPNRFLLLPHQGADLLQMQTDNLITGEVSAQPWSGDYWATYKGGAGSRYEDPKFPQDSDWKKNYDYVQANLVSDIVKTGNADLIANLSPSEKYELIVGDNLQLLTKAQWQGGKSFYERYGSVERWFGICHGWAPAAYMLDRPERMIEIPAMKHDVKVRFYPHDIKALASLLWANAQPETRFIGGRCNDKEPKRDEKGRLISEACFDNNPGTWHQVVVGEMGRGKRSMVIDATYDYEVWNQPVKRYSYGYFDPLTNEEVDTIDKARRTLSELPEDRFKPYRSPNATHVVGISMALTYMVETGADHSPESSEADDSDRTVVYLYDLELDQDGKIIGGEWYSNAHPDFVWSPMAGARAESQIERLLTEPWTGEGGVPASWTQPAQWAAENDMVLAGVVEELIRRSRAQN